MPTSFNLPTVPTTPEGGLAGFFRGTQYNYGLADLDRQFRDSDLLNQIKQNEYENALKDNQVKDKARSLESAKADFETEQYTSGFKDREAESKLAHTQAQTTGLNTESQVKQTILQADAVIGAAETLRNNPGLVGSAVWNDMVGNLRSHGIKIPDNFVDNQQNRDIIYGKAQVAYNTRKHLQDREMLGIKEAGDDRRTGVVADAAMARTKEMAKATENKQPNDPDKRALLENRSDAQAGREVSLSRIVQLAPAYVKNDQVTLEKVTSSEQQAAQVIFGKLKSNPKEFDGWLSKQGLEPSVYKVEGKYDFRAIGKDLAEKAIKGQAIEEAWDQSQRPKIPEKDVADIKAMYPVLGNKMEANNKQKGGTTQASTAKPAVANFIPPQNIEKVIAENMAAKKGASREWVIKKLKEYGRLPADWVDGSAGTTPPMDNTPVDSHAIPQQPPPMNIDVRNAMNRFVNSRQVDPSSMVD